MDSQKGGFKSRSIRSREHVGTGHELMATYFRGSHKERRIQAVEMWHKETKISEVGQSEQRQKFQEIGVGYMGQAFGSDSDADTVKTGNDRGRYALPPGRHFPRIESG